VCTSEERFGLEVPASERMEPSGRRPVTVGGRSFLSGEKDNLPNSYSTYKTGQKRLGEGTRTIKPARCTKLRNTLSIDQGLVGPV